MEPYNAMILARVLHILGVVIWIGGVAFVTMVLIPALRRYPEEKLRIILFEQLEGRFAQIAKITTLMTGLSGFYLMYTLDAWGRYSLLQYWWIHLMTLVWTIFTLVLFVFEPLFLHRWYQRHAEQDCEGTFQVMQRLHIVLLSLSLMAIAGAMAGSHGYVF